MDKATAYALRDRINLGIQKASDRSLTDVMGGKVHIDFDITILICKSGEIMLTVGFEDGSILFGHGDFVEAVEVPTLHDEVRIAIRVHDKGSVVATYTLSDGDHRVH